MGQQPGSASLLGARSFLKHHGYSAEEANPSLRLLRGRTPILAQASTLVNLARRCDQAGEADNLAYFLSTPDALKKTPYLLLIGGSDQQPAGAVLLFEYRFGPFATRVFSTADISGRRSVLAQPEHRAQTAALAARTLIDRGAQVVHITFSETHSGAGQPHEEFAERDFIESQIELQLRSAGTSPRREWTFAHRDLPVYLQLRENYDKTLSGIGKRTRTHLRYYRRRSELDLGATFVPAAQLTLEEFLAFNRECMYAVPQDLAAWRFRSLSQIAGGALRGVQDGHGRWLSLVGLRRQNHFAEIDWQMNRDGLPAYSLSTVMRSYLIEYEIAQGATRLYFEGGTWQPIVHSFATERIGELSVKRRSPYVQLLTRCANRIFPSRNYLGQALANRNIHWTSV